MKILSIIGLFFCCSILSAQDIHFTQFYNTPIKLNPANAGAFEGDLRIISNYRNQWSSLGSPYKTFGFTADMQLFKYKWKNSYLGLGLGVFNDKAGDLNLGSTQADIAVSNILDLNPKLTMTVGIQASFMQYNMDYKDAHTASQHLGYTPDLSFDPFSFFDVSAGVTWNYAAGESNLAANDLTIINFGVAFFHLNRANLSFGSTDRLFPKLVAHASSNFGLRYSKIAMMPSCLFMMQGPQIELTPGTLFRLYLRHESRYTGTISDASLLIGVHYRWNDAIIPSFGVDIGDFMVQFSYDVNISNLARSTQARGGFEFTLRYQNPELFSIGRGNSVAPKFM